jgi:hypothetical protein
MTNVRGSIVGRIATNIGCPNMRDRNISIHRRFILERWEEFAASLVTHSNGSLIDAIHSGTARSQFLHLEGGGSNIDNSCHWLLFLLELFFFVFGIIIVIIYFSVSSLRLTVTV